VRRFARARAARAGSALEGDPQRVSAHDSADLDGRAQSDVRRGGADQDLELAGL